MARLRRCVVGNVWRKACGYVMDNIDRFEALSPNARGIRGEILQREIQNDGTIVVMRHGETAIAALRRHARIVGRHDVRRWQTDAPDLFDRGFFYLHPPRVKFANFEALQAWQHKRGPKPPPYIETPDEFDPIAVFDETIGAMVDRADLAPRRAKSTSQRPVDDQSATSQRPVDDQSTEANPTEPFGADANKRETPSSSSSASKEARVNMHARGTPSGPSGRQQAARSAESTPPGDGDPSDGERIDEHTGELIDLEHERARRAAPEPSEVIEAERLELDEADAEIGDDVDWFAPIDPEELRDVPPGEPPF